MGFEEVPGDGAGVVLEEFFTAGGWVGIGGGTELLGTATLPEAGVVLGGGLVGELEAGIELVPVLWFKTCAGFTAPGTQPGTKSVSEAGPGPSVMATQPGR